MTSSVIHVNNTFERYNMVQGLVKTRCGTDAACVFCLKFGQLPQWQSLLCIKHAPNKHCICVWQVHASAQWHWTRVICHQVQIWQCVFRGISSWDRQMCVNKHAIYMVWSLGIGACLWFPHGIVVSPLSFLSARRQTLLMPGSTKIDPCQWNAYKSMRS